MGANETMNLLGGEKVILDFGDWIITQLGTSPYEHYIIHLPCNFDPNEGIVIESEKDSNSFECESCSTKAPEVVRVSFILLSYGKDEDYYI